MIRVVLTADNHLGRYYAKMSPSVLAERRKRLRRAFEQVVQFACEQQAHLFLIAGDLFDSPNPRNIERTYVADALRRLQEHNVTVIAIGGNHDTPKSSTEQGGHVPQSVYHELGALLFFDNNPAIRPWKGEIADVKVAVGGMTPSPNLLPGHNPLDGVTFDGDGAEVCVLLAHCAIEGMIHPDAQEAILSRAAIESLQGVDYLFVGNIHRYNTFVLGGKRVVVPGATEWMDFGDREDEKAGFVYLEIEPGRIDKQPQYKPITPQPRTEVLIRVTELDDDDPTATVLTRLETASGADTMLKLRIEGAIPLDLFSRLDMRRIEEVGRRDNFFFDLDVSVLRVQRPMANILAGGSRRSMREELAVYADELISTADDEEERAVLVVTKQALLAQYDELVGGR
jgi:DNA repair exonuclease SbcCD nuclease subunit